VAAEEAVVRVVAEEAGLVVVAVASAEATEVGLEVVTVLRGVVHVVAALEEDAAGASHLTECCNKPKRHTYCSTMLNRWGERNSPGLAFGIRALLKHWAVSWKDSLAWLCEREPEISRSPIAGRCESNFELKECKQSIKRPIFQVCKIAETLP
jgi:hypothetical protein